MPPAVGHQCFVLLQWRRKSLSVQQWLLLIEGPQNGLPQTAPTTPPTTAPGGPATRRPVPAPATAPTVSARAAEIPMVPAKTATANNSLRIAPPPQHCVPASPARDALTIILYLFIRLTNRPTHDCVTTDVGNSRDADQSHGDIEFVAHDLDGARDPGLPSRAQTIDVGTPAHA